MLSQVRCHFKISRVVMKNHSFALSDGINENEFVTLSSVAQESKIMKRPPNECLNKNF